MFACVLDGVQHHFQQYFNYIVAVSLLLEVSGGPVENYRPATSY